MNSGITLSFPAWDNEVKVFHDRSDIHLPIELEVGGKYTWLTGEQALELAEFLVTAIEEVPYEQQGGETNGSELQET